MERITPSPSFQSICITDIGGPAADPAWIWQGYVAPGCTTLLVGLWKAGKTTLVTALLRQMGAGGALAGLPVRAGKALVVTEEPLQLWIMRHQKFDLGAHVGLICRPFPRVPTPADWETLLDHLLALHREGVIRLVVFDALAVLLPAGSESNADLMLKALAPLSRLTEAGLAVLLVHHPRKKAGSAGTWARGTGALPGHVDILVEMSRVTAALDDRRRLLAGFSRYDATPRRLLLELDAVGTDYIVLPDAEASAPADGREMLRAILPPGEKLTRREILAAWPSDTRPGESTLWRWLDETVGAGLLHREGTGHRQQPFRYWREDDAE